MAQQVGLDYRPAGVKEPTRDEKGKLVDWVPPSPAEKAAKQYAAVRRGFEWANSANTGHKPFDCENLSEWCEKFGHDEGKLLLTAVRMGLIEECVYEEFVKDNAAKAYFPETGFDKITVADVLEAELDAAEAESAGGGVEVPSVPNRRGRPRLRQQEGSGAVGGTKGTGGGGGDLAA